MQTKLILIIVVLMAVSCKSDDVPSASIDYIETSPQVSGFEKSIEVEVPRMEKTSSPSNLPSNRMEKIMKDGSIEVDVDDLEKTKVKILEIVKSSQGFIEKEEYNAYNDRISYHYTLRIPSISYDSIVNNFDKTIGRVKSKHINAINVTEEFYDIEVRLQNNLAYLEQYRVILKNAKSIKDILDITEKIRILEEELESKKGRLQYLNDKINYSTLYLTLNQWTSTSSAGQRSFLLRILDALRGGFDGFISVLLGIIYFWPFLLLGIIFVIGYYRRRKTH